MNGGHSRGGRIGRFKEGLRKASLKAEMEI